MVVQSKGLFMYDIYYILICLYRIAVGKLFFLYSITDGVILYTNLSSICYPLKSLTMRHLSLIGLPRVSVTDP